jgi:hypothetical protein
MALRRCLLSFAETCRFYDADLDVVVADNGNNDERTSTVLRELANEPRVSSVRFIGRPERARYIDALVDELGEDARPELVYALGRYGSDGSNRNMLQLDQVGERYLSADDDVCSFFSRLAGSRLGPPYVESDLFDPTEAWFYESRDDAFTDAPRFMANPQTMFAPLLGRDVRAAQTGLVGASGMQPSAYFLACSSETTRHRLRRNYARARVSRWLRRGVTSTTLSAGDFFMTTFCGFDGEAMLPPFLPLERGADVLWGQTLRATHLSLIGHLPLLIVHDPDDGEARAPMLSELDARATPAHLVGLFLRAWPRPAFTDAADRMRGLAAWLDGVTDDARAFEALFSELRWNHLERALDNFERRVDERDLGEPAPVAEFYDDVARARAGFHAALQHTEADAPAACTFLRAFARLLTIWPDVDAAARRLRAKGIRPGIEEPPF